MKKNSIRFTDDEEGLKKAAMFIAVLVREGIDYECFFSQGDILIHTTGGF